VREAERRKKGAYKIPYLNKKAGCSHKAYVLGVVSFFALYLVSYLDTSTLPTKTLPNIPKVHVTDTIFMVTL
jgi:hypothetical protein